jgi:hypothetical protein
MWILSTQVIFAIITNRERRTYAHRIKSRVVAMGNPSPFRRKHVMAPLMPSLRRIDQNSQLDAVHRNHATASLKHRFRRFERYRR